MMSRLGPRNIVAPENSGEQRRVKRLARREPNSYAERHPKLRHIPSSYGLVAKGLQLFLPVNPRTCVALFDATTYDYGVRRSMNVIRARAANVDWINTQTALQADNAIYFLPDVTERKALNELSAARRRLGGTPGPDIEEAGVEGKPKSKLILLGHQSRRIGADFSFGRVIDETG